MSTNEIQQPLTTKDELGQVGIDGFGQTMFWGPRSGHIVNDVRGKMCELCDRGWNMTTRGWIDQYYHSSFHTLLHESCYLRYLSFKQKTHWYCMICDARLRFNGLTPIPNEYGGAWNTPWYKTTLLDHGAILKVGRRKRVNVIGIELDLPSPMIMGRLGVLFRDEDVTKGGDEEKSFYVHSWSKEKDLEYLKNVAEALGDDGNPKGGFVSAGAQKFAL